MRELIYCYEMVLTDLKQQREILDVAIGVLDRMRAERVAVKRYAELAYGDVDVASNETRNSSSEVRPQGRQVVA